ncbi:hypothetical protein [Actinoplanes sp. G11-F43]|uniref:hypothetical protein n=1 Tax=Actinoplanes sp. G11-F43 TaxID=3424130 RepID=UPI003D335371
MDDLESLVSLCPPPVAGAKCHASIDEQRGGVPEDHRRLISTYGAGCFDEFLWIYGDVDSNPNLDIRTRAAAARSDLATYGGRHFQARLDGLGISVEDLSKWGATDNGDWLLWVTTGSPDSWSTLILEVRQRDLLLVPRTSTRVILDLLTGGLVTSIFPDDFPSRQPSFSARPPVG